MKTTGLAILTAAATAQAQVPPVAEHYGTEVHCVVHGDHTFTTWCSSSWAQKRACMRTTDTVANAARLVVKAGGSEPLDLDGILGSAPVMIVNHTDYEVLYDKTSFSYRNLTEQDPILGQALHHQPEGFLFLLPNEMEGTSRRESFTYSCTVYLPASENHTNGDMPEDPYQPTSEPEYDPTFEPEDPLPDGPTKPPTSQWNPDRRPVASRGRRTPRGRLRALLSARRRKYPEDGHDNYNPMYPNDQGDWNEWNDHYDGQGNWNDPMYPNDGHDNYNPIGHDQDNWDEWTDHHDNWNDGYHDDPNHWNDGDDSWNDSYQDNNDPYDPAHWPAGTKIVVLGEVAVVGD